MPTTTFENPRSLADGSCSMTITSMAMKMSWDEANLTSSMKLYVHRTAALSVLKLHDPGAAAQRLQQKALCRLSMTTLKL